MNSEFYAIASIISILGIMWFIFWPYKAYQIASFRQAMFQIRNEFFDYAADGEIEFKHPSYIMLRDTFNGFIRFADEMSLQQLFFSILFGGRPDYERYESEFNHNVESLSEEQKAKVLQIRDKMHMQVGKYMFFRSPLIMVLLISIIIPVILFALIFSSLNILKCKLETYFSNMDAIAMKHV